MSNLDKGKPNAGRGGIDVGPYLRQVGWSPSRQLSEAGIRSARSPAFDKVALIGGSVMRGRSGLVRRASHARAPSFKLTVWMSWLLRRIRKPE